MSYLGVADLFSLSWWAIHLVYVNVSLSFFCIDYAGVVFCNIFDWMYFAVPLWHAGLVLLCSCCSSKKANISERTGTELKLDWNKHIVCVYTCAVRVWLNYLALHLLCGWDNSAPCVGIWEWWVKPPQI